MRCFNIVVVLVLPAGPVLVQQNTDCVNPTSDLGVTQIKDYNAAQDAFAYFYSPDTPSAYKTSDRMIMARVPTSQIRNEKSYRFFAGLNDDGNPRWTANFEERRPVFTDPGHCYRPEITFNPGIGKYLLLTATSGAPRWCGTDEKHLGVFEASTPWGPWHTVKQIHG